MDIYKVLEIGGDKSYQYFAEIFLRFLLTDTCRIIDLGDVWTNSSHLFLKAILLTPIIPIDSIVMLYTYNNVNNCIYQRIIFFLGLIVYKLNIHFCEIQLKIPKKSYILREILICTPSSSIFGQPPSSPPRRHERSKGLRWRIFYSTFISTFTLSVFSLLLCWFIQWILKKISSPAVDRIVHHWHILRNSKKAGRGRFIHHSRSTAVYC